jgi:hypothetical protein
MSQTLIRPGAGAFVSPWLVSLAGALLCAVVSPARATVTVPTDFAEMVAQSQLIVHGTVVDVRSQMTGGRRTIESLVTVSVLDSYKGGQERTLVFRVPGGQVGRYRRVMVGAPDFADGDEVVLFLRGRAPSLPMVFGLNQGVYRVSRSGGRGMVTPVITDGPGRVVRGDPARRPLALDAFARAVRSVTEQRP